LLEDATKRALVAALLRRLNAIDLALDVPDRFAKVLNWIALLLVTKKVLQSIADTEVLVLANLNGFYATRMRRVVRWMVY
jgi:hypothetical protein